MNCPHHHKLYAAIPRSYRDLPLRLAEYGTCHRYEQSGELFGLMRVRSLQMNDAHIYCTEDQFESEFLAVNEMYLKYFKLFGIDKYVMRFSTHDPAKLGQKFVDNSPLWLKTEDMVRGVLQRSGINYVEVPNEAAFYGPKIDVQVWSAIGREFTIATNQVDFAQPKSFGLVYKDSDNTEKTPLCIHRAPLGTHERFIGFLIEHYAGNFPLWLAPEQVRILPIGDEAPLLEYARSIQTELRAHQVRAELDASSDHMKTKIANAEQMKVHTMLVIGNRDMEANAVSLRVHGKGNLGAKTAQRSDRGSSASNQRATRMTCERRKNAPPWSSRGGGRTQGAPAVAGRRVFLVWWGGGGAALAPTPSGARPPNPKNTRKSGDYYAPRATGAIRFGRHLKRTTKTPPGNQNVPPANGPPEKLGPFWGPAPTDPKADADMQRRLLKVCEENSEELFRLLPRFSEELTEGYDGLKALADRLKAEKSEKIGPVVDLIETWLLNHKRHSSEDLIARSLQPESIFGTDPSSALTELVRNNQRKPSNCC